MDPVSKNDEIKRSSRVKQYQQIQNNQAEQDKAEKADKTGKMQGKTIKKVSSEGKSAADVFKRSTKP